MLVATITEAKNRLSALIDRVKDGESVLIVDRGTPVARLESAARGVDPEGRIARLERAGAVRAPRVASAKTVLAGPPPEIVGRASAVRALIDERRGGR